MYHMIDNIYSVFKTFIIILTYHTVPYWKNNGKKLNTKTKKISRKYWKQSENQGVSREESMNFVITFNMSSFTVDTHTHTWHAVHQADVC